MTKVLLPLVLAAACASPLPRPDAPGATAAYRRELSLHPRGPRAQEARQKLEEAQYLDARAAHTIFAYRRFLDEFPESHKGAEVRALLEGLRWAATEREGTEAALVGFLADEPAGPHAAEAWSQLSGLRLQSALLDGTPERLRAWLAQNASSAGAPVAVAALDEADYRAAATPESLRAYLDAHPAGVHRTEAAARLSQAATGEALLLEDEARLRALHDEPSAERIRYERAAALVDEGRLAQLARRKGAFAAQAARDLAALQEDPQRAKAIESAAHALFLPRATLDALPETAVDRARALRDWAAALDGDRLPRLLAELGSSRAHVALAAVDSAQRLLAGLPPAEARLRAERAAAALRPIALAAPQLAQLALVEAAAGRQGAALESARDAASRDPRSPVALLLALRLELAAGDRALVAGAARALLAQSSALAEAHGAAARAGDAAATADVCTAAALAGEAAAALGAPQEADVLRLEADQVAAAAHASCRTADDTVALAAERLAAARALASLHHPLAQAPLARAAARDPDPAVRAAAQGARTARLR